MKRLSIGETTTKEMARQARSPAINNAVKKEALASVNNRRGRKKEKKKHANTVEINVSSLTNRDRNPVSLSLSLSVELSSFSHSNLKIAPFFSFSLFFFVAVNRRKLVTAAESFELETRARSDPARSFKRVNRARGA